MMSNIPKLRFPEFSGEWEEKKIIQFCEISAGGDIDKNNSQKEFSSSYPYSVYSNSLENKGLYGYANYYKIDSDVVTVTGRGDVGHAVARHEKFVPIVRLLVCKPKNNENVDFLENAINKTKIFIESTGVPQLTAPQLGNVKLFLPSLAEQQKIADLFSNVDSIITAETKILNVLQKKKKALMQKLFTQQLRFKTNDGTDFPAWEEKKFSEVFIYHQTNTFSRNMLNYEEGDTYNIHYGDILVKFGSYIDFDNSKIPFINSDVTLNKFVSDSFLKDGDIIIADTAEDESAGKVSEVYNINNKKALSGLHTILCRPKQIFASKYLGYFMNSNVYHKQIVKLLVGTKVLSINKSVIADTIIQIPCLAEQQKIADCLSSLDSLIQNQQKVVTTWKQRKKALLQQMFV